MWQDILTYTFALTAFALIILRLVRTWRRTNGKANESCSGCTACPASTKKGRAVVTRLKETSPSKDAQE